MKELFIALLVTLGVVSIILCVAGFVALMERSFVLGFVSIIFVLTYFALICNKEIK